MKHVQARSLVTVLLLGLVISGQAGPFEITDFALHVSLSDPQISPSEKRVATVRTSATEEYQYQYEIVIHDLAGEDRFAVTQPNQYAHHPRWLSDDKISFLALTSEAGHQVFVTDLSAGVTSQVTHHDEPIQGYSWSPDFKYLVFAARPKINSSPIKAYKVEKYSLSPPKPAQLLYLLDAENNSVQTLENAAPVVDRWSQIDWAPDSSALLYMRKNSEHYDEYRSHVTRLELSSGKETTLAMGAYPQYSPDGERILFMARETPDYAVGPRKAYVMNLETAEVRRVAHGLDREVLGRWAMGEQVLLNGPEKNTQELWLASEDRAKQIELRDIEPVWPLQASSSSKNLVFIGATATSSQEIYLYDRQSVRRVSDENAELAQRTRGKTESLTWSSLDGLGLTGIVIFPDDFREGQVYPLIVSPHGGPHTTSTIAGEANNLINQSMAAHGWIVFAPNYRGSTNQGRDFHLTRVDNPNYDKDVVGDVMSGVAALRACQCIDEERKGLLGTSYGGRVAALAMALHPDEWVAAVVGNASLDDVDMYARSDRGLGFAAKYGGSPWNRESRSHYIDASPIYAASKIVTPTLILSTLRDPRVPVHSSFKFWRALEDVGTEVEFIAYDMRGHGPADLVNSMDYWQRAIDWFGLKFTD